MSDLGDRFRGVMVGTAVGDSLGRPVEGSRDPDLGYIDEIVARYQFLPYSDDTAMTIDLAESLLASDGFDGADMASRFADAWHAEPHRGYGSGVIRVFSSVRRGVPWDVAASRQFGGEGSHGNGAAMRVAPVALWAHPDLDTIIHLAEETSRVTHTHPVGMEGAVIQAVSIHHALRDDFSPDALFDDLDRVVGTDRLRTKLEVLHDALEREDDGYASSQLGNWVAADKSVLTAIYAFLRSDGFEDTIRRAIGLGGDTDTIAAMAGAVAGARWGHGAIPAEWLKVEAYEHLVDLADRMTERIQVP